MMKLLKRLLLVLTHSGQLDTIVENMKQDAKEADRLARQDNLQLCIKHQPQSIGSHYSEHNCDHCQVLDQLSKLT
jgi:hypothetical protein